MATCPSGHESASEDFCDVCGFAIGATGVRSVGGDGDGDVAASSGVGGVGGVTAPVEQCPRCGVPRAGKFCEACGYDFADRTGGGRGPVAPTVVEPLAAPIAAVAAAVWTAVVTADRAYYDSVQVMGGPDAGDIAFPVYCPERRFRLSGAEVRVGRRSAHTGIDPEIDLTGPPADPGVSRLHAVLLAAADGSWSVIDPGSVNGTLVNGTEIARDQIVPLRDGDRINVGAWTELRIVREG